MIIMMLIIITITTKYGTYYYCYYYYYYEINENQTKTTFKNSGFKYQNIYEVILLALSHNTNCLNTVHSQF